MKRRVAAWAVAGVVALLHALPFPGVAQELGSGVLPFTEVEKRAILGHGPWPVPFRPDPSNRVSGKREASELGELLFFDPRLSRTGDVSCATCHLPERYWTDNRDRGVALGKVDRNTPHLFNQHLNRWYGWDGAADSLWSQSIRPIVDPRELGASPPHVAGHVRKDPEVACRYEKAFGKPPSAADDEAVLVDVGKAMAAFQEVLTSGRTPFDEFRDALDRGDMQAASRYSLAAQRGLRLFIGKGACNTCHTGPNFTNGEFAAIGTSHFVEKGRVDPGRHQGIRTLLASRFNLLGPYNDDPARATAASTRHVKLEHRHFGEFRVPSLRQSVQSAPYMHDGQLDSLQAVVQFYSDLPVERLHADGEQILKPLKLAKQESQDLLVFLESLTNHRVAQWRARDHHEWPVCRK